MKEQFLSKFQPVIYVATPEEMEEIIRYADALWQEMGGEKKWRPQLTFSDNPIYKVK